MLSYQQINIGEMASMYRFKCSTVKQAFEQPFPCPQADAAMERLFDRMSREEAIRRFAETPFVIGTPAHWAAVRRIAQFFPLRTN